MKSEFLSHEQALSLLENAQAANDTVSRQSSPSMDLYEIGSGNNKTILVMGHDAFVCITPA